MKPVRQSVEGLDGDCYAACVASILEIGLDEVSVPKGTSWGRLFLEWLTERGWQGKFYPGGVRSPTGWAIASQRVRDGSIHAVVCFDGKIVHDPSSRPWGEGTVVLWTVLRKQNDSSILTS